MAPFSLPEHAGEQNGKKTDASSYAGHENPSLQVTADHRIKMAPAPVLRPGRGEVLLHIKVTGICG